MPVITFKEHTPEIPHSTFIAPNAWVIGNVRCGQNVTILFGAVLRGDIEPILIGDNSNIQDNCVLHTSTGKSPCTVCNNVTIGHGVKLHSSTIKDFTIIGMGSTVLDGAVVEEECLIGANSLITPETRIPRGSLAFGSPAKVVRPLNDQELNHLRLSAQHYIDIGRVYKDLFDAKI